ncbi:MAG: DUF2971 domain-containing protein [Candidatus Enterosoma sp.]|nr:DUF2971 domain-containing protein [Bacilli bacterium]MDY3047866.1 DUF2971 domain-containing protein [Candidatus Enterosoma sp.]
MNNEEKIAYLNQIIFSNLRVEYMGPKLLYKYRPFDKYSFDMLENNYLFLCPAENEDDKTECLTTVDLDRLMDLEKNNLKIECINQIIDYLKPYMNVNDFETARNSILAIIRKNGTVPARFMLDLSQLFREKVTDCFDTAPLVNWIVNIPEKLNEPEIRNQIMPLLSVAYNARKETGICSLAESGENDYMWANYAVDSTGYCIEYDLSYYELAKNVLPVIYQDNRETNIIIQLVASFIGQMITGYSNGQIQADSSHFLRLFLTKNKKWEYQKEWRFIGNSFDKPEAPKIKRIFLGTKASESDKKRMKEFARSRNIEVVE